MKRLLSVLLSFVLVLGLLPVQAFAAEAPTEQTGAVTEPMDSAETATEAAAGTAETEDASTVTTPETTAAAEETQPQEASVLGEEAPEVELTETAEKQALPNEELFAGYVERVFYGSNDIMPFSVGSQTAGSKLTGDEAAAYNALAPLIKQIAVGERAYTQIKLSPTSSEAQATFTGTITEFEWELVLDALCADFPYEMYWYNPYAVNVEISYPKSALSGPISYVTFKLPVDPTFRYDGQVYFMSTTKAKAASVAAANAQAIASKHAAKSDYQKLCAFRDEICNLVCYDYNAVENNLENENVNPWQLIYVFDYDTSTNVVCEGYAEAFQYLCDLSGLTCYSVRGKTSGNHKWNIVTLEGKNYLVDLTNSDKHEDPNKIYFGFDGSLFLAGTAGSVAYGYTFYNSLGNTLTYTYRDTTIDLWGEKILTLASTKYVPGAHIHSYTLNRVAATCTAQGYDEYICSCGSSYQSNYIAALGHNQTTIPAVAATCTAAGKSAGVKCSRCKLVLTAPKTVPALGHDYVYRLCSRCGVPNDPDCLGYGSCGNIVNWILEADGTLYIAGKGEMDDYGLNENNAPWISFEDGIIKKIVIEDGVTSIGDYAFYDIGHDSGQYSEVDVTIADSVTRIGHGAFLRSGLTELSLSRYVTTLEDSAFNGCDNLTSVTVPETVTSVGESVFYSCDNLVYAKILANVSSLRNWFEGCTSLADVTLPDNVTDLTDAFKNCSSLSEIALPDGVESIYGAFTNCTGLTQIDVPDSVTTMDWAFYGCTGLVDANIPDGVTTLDYAFDNCRKLTAITVPDSVLSMKHTFSGCSKLTEVVLSNNVTNINSAFYQCTSLKEIVVPESVISMGSAFRGCTALVKANIPDGVTSIDSTFDGCSNLEEITIPDSVTSMRSAFSGCEKLTAVVVPGSVENMDRAFMSCDNLASVVLSENLTNTYMAFSYCTKLQTIFWPVGLTDIDSLAFTKCNGIKTVFYGGTEEQWNALDFDTKSFFDNATIYFRSDGSFGGSFGDGLSWEVEDGKNLVLSGEGSMLDYDSSEEVPWAEVSGLIEEVTVGEEISYVGNGGFAGCENLREIYFRGEAPAFGEKAFEGVTATAYYPMGNGTWEDVIQNTYGGTVAWVAKCYAHQEETVPGKEATCTENGLTEGKKCSVCGEELKAQKETPLADHDYTNAEHTYDALNRTHTAKCDNCDHIQKEDCTFDEGTVTKQPTTEETGVITYTCTACQGTYEEVMDMISNIVRIAGSGRYVTATETATELKTALGVEKFQTVVVASGENFPDALAGSYLAAVTKAPILLTTKAGSNWTKNYIAENLAPGGTIYLLGSVDAISQSYEDTLNKIGTVKRLKGDNRWETCVAILTEAGGNANEVLVCSGNNENFADALSASAVGKPILLINGQGTKLQPYQKEYLAGKHIIVIGDNKAVSDKQYANLAAAGASIERVQGGNRVLTSVAVAKRFFPQTDFAVLAYGGDYPDALCGGPLAYLKGGPVLLAMPYTSQMKAAAEYIANTGITKGVITGDETVVADKTARTIFGLTENDIITEK